MCNLQNPDRRFCLVLEEWGWANIQPHHLLEYLEAWGIEVLNSIKTVGIIIMRL